MPREVKRETMTMMTMILRLRLRLLLLSLLLLLLLHVARAVLLGPPMTAMPSLGGASESGDDRTLVGPHQVMMMRGKMWCWWWFLIVMMILVGLGDEMFLRRGK